MNETRHENEVCVLVTVDKNDGYVESSVYKTFEQAVGMVKGMVRDWLDNDACLELVDEKIEKSIRNTGKYDGDPTVYHVFMRRVNG